MGSVTPLKVDLRWFIHSMKHYHHYHTPVITYLPSRISLTSTKVTLTSDWRERTTDSSEDIRRNHLKKTRPLDFLNQNWHWKHIKSVSTHLLVAKQSCNTTQQHFLFLLLGSLIHSPYKWESRPTLLSAHKRRVPSHVTLSIQHCVPPNLPNQYPIRTRWFFGVKH